MTDTKSHKDPDDAPVEVVPVQDSTPMVVRLGDEQEVDENKSAAEAAADAATTIPIAATAPDKLDEVTPQDTVAAVGDAATPPSTITSVGLAPSVPAARPGTPATKEATNTPNPADSADVKKLAGDERADLGHDPHGGVIQGMEDDVLWALLRRFDTQINHVLQPARTTPPSQPDLRMTNLPDVAFRSDTLKSNFERVFSAAGPACLQGVGQIARLTDWQKEKLRTGIYCSAYFISWWFGYALVTTGFFISVLIAFPATRRYLFPQDHPHARKKRPSATDPTDTKGDESLLPTTGYRSRAEQAEEQAFEARAVFEAYATTVVVGGRGGRHSAGDPSSNSSIGEKHLEADTEHTEADPVIKDEGGDVVGVRHVGDAKDDSQTDAAGNATIQDATIAQAHDTAVGGQRIKVAKGQDPAKVAALEAKRKRDAMVSRMAKATETGLGSAADFVEIIQNAVSPPKPYPDHHARYKLAAALVLAPVLAIHIIPTWMFGRLATFSFGFALWGQPIAKRAVQEFIRLVPNWQELLDLRNSLLSGTPTNAQLTLHLLRVAEDFGEPLPPPPPPPDAVGRDALTDKSPVQPTPGANTEDKGKVGKVVEKKKHRVRTRLASTFQSVSRHVATFRGDVTLDNKEKKIGNSIQDKLVRTKFGGDSPDAYGCKLNGKAGHIILDWSQDKPRVGFIPVGADSVSDDQVWDVDDILELRKEIVSVPRMAFGWLGGASVDSLGLDVRFIKNAAALALDTVDTKPGVDAKIVTDTSADNDETIELRSVERRDALFNRLIALGDQRWELL